MCTQTIPLPQIRRMSSGDVREEWKRMTNYQRRLSYDFKISETNSIKHKSFVKMQKISTKQLINNTINKQTISSGLRIKSSIERISLNASNAVPVVGDHQTLLNGSQLLELFNKLQDYDSMTEFETSEMIKVNSKRNELKRLLRLKCKSCIRDECLSHSLKANSFVRDLREIYFEDNYKLNVIKISKTDDKRKLRVLDSFVKSCNSRKTVCEEIDQKTSSWISMITNANRLMNVTHIRPNDEGLELVLQTTLRELKFLRLFSLNLLKIILEINIEIMTLIIDLLPFECISQICTSIENFNQLLVSNQMKTLDLISVVALNQSKVTTNKFLYYLYNEINKNFQLIHQKDNKLNITLRNSLESEDITSDYFSADSNSTAINLKNRPSSHDSKYLKDFKIVFNILIQSNQRILLKIIFGHQDQLDKLEQNQIKSCGYRQKWFKSNEVSNERQQRICRELDKHFWDTFWAKFDDLIESSLCFCDISHVLVPISALCNPTKGRVIHTLLKLFIRSEELLDEAIKSLEFSSFSLAKRLSLYNYSKNYQKISNLINKSISLVDNKLGTSLGSAFFDCLEPLIGVRISLKGPLNETELIFDNIIINVVNMFTAFIESKQSTELDNKFLDFIALSILDTNNLIEIITTLNSKRITELIETLNNIKENAFIKSKEYIFSKSYQMISKSIPSRDYRRKICSTNSEWIENIIRIILQPITDFLGKDTSFETNILQKSLNEEFSKAFVGCVFNDKKLRLKFSYSGAVQFNKDVNCYWDWMVTNNIQTTDFSSITKLKSFAFSLISKEVPTPAIITRNNRINPEMSPIVNNHVGFLPNSEPNFRRNYMNCFPFILCSYQ